MGPTQPRTVSHIKPLCYYCNGNGTPNPCLLLPCDHPSVFLNHSLSPAHAASELVEGVCHESQSYSFCIQALESDPKTPATKDYMDLAVIALKLGISNSTATRSYISRLYKNPKTDPRKKPALKGCLSGYDEAVESFKSALGN
ncbi:hypothetical protein CK203_018090 [Vitis vinifera]|uniref:Pectinesterase inhibitor domain-containing protein n=1 Tax=Vitis vinifera TaxID=29760 RepID=A0A438JW81_VITVI|nr:hypothetical protein CK203_018090 [Vitis vinifera]